MHPWRKIFDSFCIKDDVCDWITYPSADQAFFASRHWGEGGGGWAPETPLYNFKTAHVTATENVLIISNFWNYDVTLLIYGQNPNFPPSTH